jgi:hypothetical protein
MAKAEKNHFIIDFITFDHRNFPEKSEGIQMAETYRAGTHAEWTAPGCTCSVYLENRKKKNT